MAMMLVLENDPERPHKIAVRIVLEEDDKQPDSLLDIRVMLQRALNDLPGRISLIPFKRFDDKRKR